MDQQEGEENKEAIQGDLGQEEVPQASFAKRFFSIFTFLLFLTLFIFLIDSVFTYFLG